MTRTLCLVRKERAYLAAICPGGPATGENSRDAEVEPLPVLPLFASGAPSVKSGVAQLGHDLMTCA